MAPKGVARVFFDPNIKGFRTRRDYSLRSVGLRVAGIDAGTTVFCGRGASDIFCIRSCVLSRQPVAVILLRCVYQQKLLRLLLFRGSVVGKAFE